MDNVQINSGAAISYGWQSVKKDFWYFVAIALIVFVAGSIGSNNTNWSIWDFVGFLLATWMTCSYTRLFLSYQGGTKLPLNEMFTYSKQYVRVLTANVLLGLIVGIGFVFLIVPGVYFALKYQFTIQLLIDKNLSISEAMNQSAKLSAGRKMSLLSFDLMCLGVVLLGALALGVGILAAMPVVGLAMITVYRKLLIAA